MRINSCEQPEGGTVAEINPTAINPFNRNAQAQPTAASSTISETVINSAPNFWGEDGFTFGDILDLINPLQHILIVGTIYRAVTGDDISTGSRIIGGGLFGGVFGVGAAVASAIIEEVSGEDVDEHIIAMFERDATPAPDGTPAPAVLASAAYGRQAQETPGSDWAPREPATATMTVAALAGTERDYASNPAFSRGAQEATTTPPVADVGAADITDPVVAALPVEPPVVQLLAAVEEPLSLIPSQAAWLAAVPRVESDFTATAIRYVTPQTGLQIAQAITGNGDLKPTGELNPFTRFAIDRYS